VVVLTDGPRGSFAAASPTEILHVPAFDTAVIDTTGCGDAFHGAYAVALARSEDLTSRLSFASAAAAVIAARASGEQRTPTTDEINQLLGDASSSNQRR
jgi:sulfofructose kinase